MAPHDFKSTYVDTVERDRLASFLDKYKIVPLEHIDRTVVKLTHCNNLGRPNNCNKLLINSFIGYLGCIKECDVGAYHSTNAVSFTLVVFSPKLWTLVNMYSIFRSPVPGWRQNAVFSVRRLVVAASRHARR